MLTIGQLLHASCKDPSYVEDFTSDTDLTMPGFAGSVFSHNTFEGIGDMLTTRFSPARIDIFRDRLQHDGQSRFRMKEYDFLKEKNSEMANQLMDFMKKQQQHT